jgi:hypothetical protein
MVGRPNRRGWGWIRKLPSKRHQASYVGPDDTRHYATLTFTQKTDAEHWLADERRLIERDEWTSPAARTAAKRAKTVTVAEYGQRWIDHRTLKPRTRNSYQSPDRPRWCRRQRLWSPRTAPSRRHHGPSRNRNRSNASSGVRSRQSPLQRR